MARAPTPPEPRFWAKVEKRPFGCWVWQGKASQGGSYGRITVADEGVSAHAFSWLLHRGEIPSGVHLHHDCRNTMCVNPEHLAIVTPLDHAHLTTGELGPGNRSPRGGNITLLHALQTHCHRGHPFDEKNTYRYQGPKSVWRKCRPCKNLSMRQTEVACKCGCGGYPMKGRAYLRGHHKRTHSAPAGVN